MTDNVTVSTGGIGPEVSLAISTAKENIIIKRYKGAEGLKALDGLIRDLNHERTWLATELERERRFRD